ncbi:hypothetical protein Vadar_015609 [Vaccinium darrowii]|uniref:Uncharacterized protein n=1 Tax=Vaccinium darrowii TaxID=229202 RepID=A0ACB7YF11_9ERIC|nr:hypothetical protein Vadar_015609 [Vaccinium darrowii]
MLTLSLNTWNSQQTVRNSQLLAVGERERYRGGRESSIQRKSIEPYSSLYDREHVPQNHIICCSATLKGELPLVGNLAPDFKAEAAFDQEFIKVKLSDYIGKKYAIFFYPLDFTFVCPTDSNRDRFSEFEKLNTEILGVSIDSVSVSRQPHNVKHVPDANGTPQQNSDNRFAFLGAWTDNELDDQIYLNYVEDVLRLTLVDHYFGSYWQLTSGPYMLWL